MKLLFPKNATPEEIKSFSNLPCFGEITDADFPYGDSNIESKNKICFCVRILLIDNDKICIEYSRKYNYIQILGGHIEDGESIEYSAKRETVEEGGYEVNELTPIGYFIENGIGKKHISFVYVAKPGKFIGTSYEEDEIECGFESTWYKIEDGLNVLARADSTYINSYNGRFATKRDLILLQKLTESL